MLTEHQTFPDIEGYQYCSSKYKTSEENGIEVIDVRYVKKDLLNAMGWRGIRGIYVD